MESLDGAGKRFSAPKIARRRPRIPPPRDRSAASDSRPAAAPSGDCGPGCVVTRNPGLEPRPAAGRKGLLRVSARVSAPESEARAACRGRHTGQDPGWSSSPDRSWRMDLVSGPGAISERSPSEVRVISERSRHANDSDSSAKRRNRHQGGIARSNPAQQNGRWKPPAAHKSIQRWFR